MHYIDVVFGTVACGLGVHVFLLDAIFGYNNEIKD